MPKHSIRTDDKAFLIKPEYGMKDLSRADKAFLMQAGMEEYTFFFFNRGRLRVITSEFAFTNYIIN